MNKKLALWVTAITATTVTVAIEAPTEDIADAEVVVKNTAGQVYATKAVSIKAGATSATFSFETPLTVSPTEGWTVNGVKYVVAELAIANVERLSNTGKFLEVQFNKPLTSLEVSELNIRRADTLERVGVEKVTLASDGLSAQITLIGDEATATFVRPLVDYTLSVTQGGKVTSKVFNLDQVVAERLLSTIDAKENSVNGLKLASDVALDLEHALGRTATYWYDKDSFITRINLLDETVKYDALKVDTRSNKDYVTLVTEGKEYLVASNATVIEKTTNGLRNVGLVKSVKDADFEYGKVIFNKQGQVQTIIAVEKFSGQLLVEKMNGELVVAHGNELNLKDYTILKDGRTITASDIKADDVVHYNSSIKFAEVYSNDVTGKISAVYDMKFRVNDEVYTVDAGTQYIKDGKVTRLDQEGIEALEASEKAVVLHFDRAGKLKFVTGELGEVISSTTPAYITKNATAYDFKGAKYVSLPVQYADGTKATEEFKSEDLKEITLNGLTYKVGEKLPAGAVGITGTAPQAGNHWVVSGFTIVPGATSDVFTITLNVTEYKADNTIYNPTPGNTNKGQNITFVNDTSNGDFDKSKSMQVIKDDEGSVIGFELRTVDGLDTDANANNDTAVLKPGDKVVKIDDSVIGTAVKSVQITSKTPVFIENANNTITSTTFGELSSDINEITAAKVYHDGVDVEYLVLNHNDIKGPEEAITTETVIADVLYDKSGNVSYLKVMENGVAKEYTVKSKLAVAGLEIGDIVTIDVNKVTGAVDKIVEDAATPYVLDTDTVKVSEGKFDLNGPREVAASGVKVYEIVTNGSKVTVEERTFSDLANLEVDNEVKASALNGHAKYVDTIVITKNVEPAGPGTPGPGAGGSQYLSVDASAATEVTTGSAGSFDIVLTTNGTTFANTTNLAIGNLPNGYTQGITTPVSNTAVKITINSAASAPDFDTDVDFDVIAYAGALNNVTTDQVKPAVLTAVDEKFSLEGDTAFATLGFTGYTPSLINGSATDISTKQAIGDLEFEADAIGGTTNTLNVTVSGGNKIVFDITDTGSTGDIPTTEVTVKVTGKDGSRLEGKTGTIKFTPASNGDITGVYTVAIN